MSAPVVLCGGTSETRPATAEIQAIADKAKREAISSQTPMCVCVCHSSPLACPPSAGSDPCGPNMAPCTTGEVPAGGEGKQEVPHFQGHRVHEPAGRGD
ncbi:uncharacterized protein LOC118676881 isoform X3 [Myotis myotis]|uniref:uncharacterized protein LOC118676881 isoform X3 n=1 Tax=Myotis myotis TaxID=51298 RepID=UPI0017486541|nr:uncharacterized protein LOC118676881 isoform X3 [Myotis myotis]